MNALEQFKKNTVKFVKDAVPDASPAKRRKAVKEIIKNFSWMFTKKGNIKQSLKDQGISVGEYKE
jgi:hypothetical protein